ncbi:uroporphyrinogen-III synthase [Micromonospora sonneratiae]|uniref:Uroporphyrinogen-III synthase n=1 Tax=Micromonospora sonneratiae TaxID=1184706 RepID=A0ABW3YL56_9ACTN
MSGELTGFTIGIPADRGRDELAALLEHRGARVVVAPALRIAPLLDDTRLRAATLACLKRPPDVLVASTGLGVRGWLTAAEGWGLAGQLRSALSRAYIVTCGAPADVAVRATGLATGRMPATQSCDEAVEHLRNRGVADQVVAVLLHGERRPECTAILETAGAEQVIEVSVYRWAPATDPAPLSRLVDLVTGRLVDAVTFTSAPAVDALLQAAGPRVDAMLAALRRDVLAAGVGPVTAAPLRRHQVPVLVPDRARLDALARTLADELPTRSVSVRVAGHQLTLRGHAAVIDGELRPLAPAPMAVLRALAGTPGRVLSRAALLRTLPRGADGHAVEMAVARIRAGLRAPGVVQTVVKRGYRLAVD